MSHSSRVRSAPGWLSLVAASATVASVVAVAPPLAPNDIHTVRATEVALAARTMNVDPPVSTLFDPNVTPFLANASTAIYRQLLASFQDPQQQEVLGDFFHGGIAGVLKKQATSRLKSPDQTQILNDFFQGGVYQSEAHRFLQLFTDPNQHQFISDFVTGGLIQVVRNRLLDATADPGQRAAIISFLPDEVTDYRGGPIAVVQRRLIAAAKGNPVVIGLVNGIFENPIVVAVQHVLGGGPLIGTPLHELPPITPGAAVAPPHTVAVAVAVAEPTPAPTQTPTQRTTATTAASTTTITRHTVTEPEAFERLSTPTAAPETPAKPTPQPSADVMKTGNKVEPLGATRPTSADSSDGTPETAAPTAAPTTGTQPAATGDAKDDTSSTATSE